MIFLIGLGVLAVVVVLFGILLGEQKDVLKIAITMLVFAICIFLIITFCFPYIRSLYEDATSSGGLLTDSTSTTISEEIATTSAKETETETSEEVCEENTVTQSTTAVPIVIVDGNTYVLSDDVS